MNATVHAALDFHGGFITVDGVEYTNKEGAATLCREFALNHKGTKFHNYAHHKCVRRPAAPEEAPALTVTVYEWNKLYTDAEILKTHPELKGLWLQNLKIGRV